MSNRNPLDYSINKPLSSGYNPIKYIFKDIILYVCLLSILIFGLAMLYSSSGQSISMVIRQSVYIFSGLILMTFISHQKPDSYKNLLMHSYWIGLFLLVYVLLFPASGYSTSRWIDLGFFSFQPSEIIRLILPLSLIAYLCRKESQIQLLDWFYTTLAAFICSYLVFKQPDLGTSILIALSGLAVIWLSGVNIKYFIYSLLIFVVSAPFVITFLEPYQKLRILAFFNPERDPLGSGYQIIQSKIAVGSGGLYGKGFLKGTQSYLEFLPEKHTDFIFTLFSEEHGFIGSLGLLLIYVIMIYRIILIGSICRTFFSKLFCYGFGSAIFIYIVVNMSMVLGMVPIVGSPLPFMSYG